MGPQPFDCGNARKSLRIIVELPLQWGRSLSTAEMLIRGLPAVWREYFNGAAAFRLRKYDIEIPGFSERFGLQWGRSLSTAEMSPLIKEGN